MSEGDLAALTGDLPFATDAMDVVRIEQQGGRAGRGSPKRRCDGVSALMRAVGR
ncbi:hypothetical protein K4749_39440 [Streptomyces sp. TRM72054]|uniref:hypothetical protein n=1 Tax=Streptomyces sp. TRM72054 TaxID=2870562 RepID=UPI001C8C75FB|nr:hypothetical protein [Streptomyces sp. TRM72054]MBX9399454.1 hypothetical protein [Streptomyces sp. TRM72054]